MSIDSAKGLWLDCRVYAFLDTLAYSEDADYDTVVNGTVIRSGNDPSLVGQRNVSITDFSQHPNILVKVGSNLTSTAAGRYQFLHKTWSGLGLPDFSPINQDIGAIVLMQGRGVINPLLRGNVKTAITKGNGEWASLPGSRYGQRTRKMSELINIYDRALSECFALRSPG
jgi:muramidase (phage lysozyme)